MMFNMVQALNQAMAQEMEKDPRVLVLGEDIGVDGGVFRLTDSLLEKFGPNASSTLLWRIAIVGTSIGMAAAGLRPIAEIQFMGFIYLAMNRSSPCRPAQEPVRGRFTVPMVIRMPYGAGVRSLEHHSESTEALFCQIPGLKVVVPSTLTTPRDCSSLPSATMTGHLPGADPLYRAGRQEVPEELYEIPLGQAGLSGRARPDYHRLGRHDTGRRTGRRERGKDGVFPEVVDLRTLAPLDRKTVIESVKRTGRLLVVHEAPKTCGLGAEIAAFVSEKAMLNLEAPVLRITGQDITVPLAKGEDYYYPSPERVAWGIKKIMEF